MEHSLSEIIMIVLYRFQIMTKGILYQLLTLIMLLCWIAPNTSADTSGSTVISIPRMQTGMTYENDKN